MSSFDVEKYVPTINTILRISDLATISAKQIRNALAREFPNDKISENKGTLNKRILECFRTIREEREGSSDEEDSRVTSRPTQDLLKSDSALPSSPAKRSVPASTLSRPVKKPRPSAPSTNQLNSAKHDNYDSDEDAKFAMELDQALNSTPVRKTRGASSGTTKKPRSKKSKKDEGEEKPKKKRKINPNSAFHAPMLLSPQLSEVVQETELPRPTVVKKLWEYIRSNNLQNPANRTEILCDDKLRDLFSCDKIKMFTMNKVLSKHLWSKADVVEGDSSGRKISTSANTSSSSVAKPSPKKNGRPVLSEAVVKSESGEESNGEASEEESHFSDSEEDR